MFKYKSNAERIQDEGIRLAERGHHTEAIEYFIKALEIEPENGEFRYNLGLAYANSGDFDKALDEFKISIRYKPDHYDSYFAIATNLFSYGSTWKSAIYYLAYLEFSKTGEVARASQSRLAEMSKEALTFNAISWYNIQVMLFKSEWEDSQWDNSLFDSEEIRTTKKILGGMEKMYGKMFVSQLSEFCAKHIDNGKEFIRVGKNRAAIAQLFTGLEILPVNFLGLCMLSIAYARAGDHQIAGDFLDLLNSEKIDPDKRLKIRDQSRRVRAMMEKDGFK